MKTIAVICNAVLFAFTCVVLATDGLPTKAAYAVFTLWVLGTLIFSAVAILRMGAADGRIDLRMKSRTAEGSQRPDDAYSGRRGMRIAAICCNIVLLGFICWALVDQHPHPKEAGFIEYAVLMALTPALSAFVLYRGVRRARGLQSP